MLTIVCLGLVVAPALGSDVAVSAEEAIARVVAERMGVPVAAVGVDVSPPMAAATRLHAIPDPAARVGRPSRFVLMAGGSRHGIAVARVTVVARFPRAARAIARDQAIEPGDVDVIESVLPPVAVRRIPDVGQIVGTRARRDIAMGEPLTDAVLVVPPVVRSGDRVSVTVRLGVVEATGTGVASGSGQVGDLIGILRKNSTRTVKARIVGPGAVEIVQ